MTTIPNRFPKACTVCGVLVSPGEGVVRAEGTRIGRSGIERTNWRTYHHHCKPLDIFETQSHSTEEDRDMATDEIVGKIGYMPGQLPPNAPLTGERRVAIRAYARAQGIPGEIVNSRMSADDLRAVYNGILTSAEAIAKYAEAIAKYTAAETTATIETVSDTSSADTADATLELARALAKLTSTNKAPLDENRVIALIREHAPKPDIQRIEIAREERDGSTTTADLGLQHKTFPKLLKMAQARTPDGFPLNIWLAGPAGTGKTTAAANLAKALGCPFYFNGALDTEYKLTGFTDANGRVTSTAFREAYTSGGVYLFDEVDASLPPALLAINAGLANGHCDFPGGAVARHPDFICIAAANTYGNGADMDYVGRAKLDAAFLDRFVFCPWEIDEALERALCPVAGWAERVQHLRAAAARAGIKIVISPRATYHGAALIRAGFTTAEAEEATVWGRLKADQRQALRAAA
jgi:cobaltochelatase CobS